VRIIQRLCCSLISLAGLFFVYHAASQPSAKTEKETKRQALQWDPPNVDAPIRSLSQTPPCDLAKVLEQAAVRANEMATNLEKFSAEEQIQYEQIRRGGEHEADAGTFNYVFAFERHKEGRVSREYRTPTKGSHVFPASAQDTGQVALALIFHPKMQVDYEMRCEGQDDSRGQPAWVIHFEQRKDRPGRTQQFSVEGVPYPARLKGRAWISTENFQVLHLQTGLLGDMPLIRLRNNTVSVDYAPVPVQGKKDELWLPQSIHAFWEFEERRVMLVHTLSSFQLFTVETQEKIQAPKQP